MFFILHVIAYATFLTRSFSERISTKSIEQLMFNYEDDRNSLVAVTEKADEIPFEDFYEEIDPRVGIDVHSLNTIYFGPTWAFMRLDTESILHILINTNRKMIPISRVLLAWDLITDGLTAAFLQGREYIAFGELLELVPEEDLYYVNFGDNSVLRYFANIDVDLSPRKYGILAAAYRRFYGTEWYRNGTYISELGYLICGFPSSDLARIRPDVLITINVDLFSKLRKCTRNQTMTLYQIATHHKAFGHPNKWTSNDVRKMEYLFTYIHESDISSITFEAVSAISAAVIRDLDDLKVLQFTKPQILTFNPPARREYILKMQYITNLPLDKISRVSKSNSVISIYIQMLLIVIILC